MAKKKSLLDELESEFSTPTNIRPGVQDPPAGTVIKVKSDGSFEKLSNDLDNNPNLMPLGGGCYMSIPKGKYQNGEPLPKFNEKWDKPEPTGFDVDPLADDKGQVSLFNENSNIEYAKPTEQMYDGSKLKGLPYHREDEIWRVGATGPLPRKSTTMPPFIEKGNYIGGVDPYRVFKIESIDEPASQPDGDMVVIVDNVNVRVKESFRFKESDATFMVTHKNPLNPKELHIICVDQSVNINNVVKAGMEFVIDEGHTLLLGKGLGALFNHPGDINPTKKIVDNIVKASKDDNDPVKRQEIFEKLTWQKPPKERLWVGIDPGKSGGIAAMSENGLVGMWEIPKIGDDIDSARLCDILMALNDSNNASIMVEDVHSLFGMSASTNFSMGHTLGIIIGVVTACRMRLIRVQPKQWQKEIWVNSDYEYLPIKPKQKKPSVDTKLTSLKAAHRLFPRADFRGEIKVEYYADSSANRKKGIAGQQIPSKRTKDHDGIIDAVCIAEFARRKNV